MTEAIDAISYVEQAVRPSAIGDIVNVARFHARKHEDNNGHYSTPRNVFCYADHLGFIAFGGDSTPRTVRFIREFFPSRYAEYSELLVCMWRHDTVHQLRPYRYKCFLEAEPSQQIEVRWVSTNHNRKFERAQHLLTFPMEDTSNAVYFVVNGCQLADDLIVAIDRLLGALRAGDVRAEECATRIQTLQVALDCDRVGKSLAPAVREQIRRAWRERGGLLDRDGNVTQPHPMSRA